MCIYDIHNFHNDTQNKYFFVIKQDTNSVLLRNTNKMCYLGT